MQHLKENFDVGRTHFHEVSNAETFLSTHKVNVEASGRNCTHGNPVTVLDGGKSKFGPSS